MSPPADVTAPAGAAVKTAHPLAAAGRELAADFLSTIAFAVLFALTHNARAAAGVGIGLGIGQFAWRHLRGRPHDAMQWMSLGLVLVFGTASLLTGNPTFVMLKPTLIYVVVGTVMLKRGWMTRYLPPIARQWAGDVCDRFGYVWSGLMFLTGALNLVLVRAGSPEMWGLFVTIFPLASKLTLILLQYLILRIIVRRRMRASLAAAEG